MSNSIGISIEKKKYLNQAFVYLQKKTSTLDKVCLTLTKEDSFESASSTRCPVAGRSRCVVEVVQGAM